MYADRIALQLYTLRHQTAQDFLGALRDVADAGYRAVEFAGYGGLSMPALRAAINDLGIKAISSHVSSHRFDNDLPTVIEELHALGCEYAVVPAVPEEQWTNPDAIRCLAETFNRWGEQCKSGGVQFGYHNHAVEFCPLDGATAYELLVAETDADLVHLQLDVYWALHAGQDPVELLQRYSSRVSTLHAKEMSDQADRSDTTVGDGNTPWQKVLTGADRAGIKWYIVEQEDDPKHALRDIRRSRANLESLGVAVRRRKGRESG